ncbi:MAG: sigma-70 family RNA polymerase sigma factor [Clostridia bacterium]|nr:sigma-70 family RNA polymerase sigma factor [Clostridia bacterium]
MDHGALLYRRFLDGEEQAFDELLQMFREPLTLFLCRYVGDYHTAEDLSIDAFTWLLVHPRHYNFKTPFKTYLFMIGRSRALDFCKHRAKITFTDLEEVQATDPDTPETLLVKDERMQILYRAIASLPAEQAAVIHLVYFEDQSYEQVARVLHKSKKQIDNLLYRAKKELREMLGEEGRTLL